VDQSAPNAQSFIIKIWLEATVEENGYATWRGYIIHVPSGTRRYLNDPDDILAFIAPYLQEMGVRLGLALQIRLWLRRWTRPTRRKPEP